MTTPGVPSRTRELLSIVADVAAIFGVSVATIATALFSIKDRVNVWNTVFAISQSLLFLAAVAIFLILSRVVLRYFGSKFHNDTFNKRAILFAVLMFFISIALLCGMAFYEYISSFRYLQ